MPHHPDFFPSIWRRAIQRESLGLVIRFSDGQLGAWHLRQHRPAGCDDYTVCRTGDPNVIILARPEVNIDAERHAQNFALINADLAPNNTPDLD